MVLVVFDQLECLCPRSDESVAQMALIQGICEIASRLRGSRDRVVMVTHHVRSIAHRNQVGVTSFVENVHPLVREAFQV